MRHRVAGRKLNCNTAQRKALLRGLTTELFKHGSIHTTEAKAKSLRPVAEKLITLAKRGDLHALRQAAAWLYVRDDGGKKALHKLFDEVADHYRDRPGGYTRIYKLGPRKGDAAPMALIELIDYEAIYE